MTMKDLQSEAMKLPVSRRAQLAAALLSSLDSDEPAEIEAAWIREADRRYKAYARAGICYSCCRRDPEGQGRLAAGCSGGTIMA